jgi:carboxypeptidase C (cathepsin A)
MLGYLAEQSVQKALGARVNYTELTDSVQQAYAVTGDVWRSGPLEDLGFVLDRGVRVAMIHGDRDATCNWLGGENISLAINWREKEAFRSAGYTELRNDKGETKGMTRQHSGLSFTRIFQAGELIGDTCERRLMRGDRPFCSSFLSESVIQHLQASAIQPGRSNRTTASSNL